MLAIPDQSLKWKELAMMFQLRGLWKECSRAFIGSRLSVIALTGLSSLTPLISLIFGRNEVKDKVLFSAVKHQMNGKGGDPCIYTAESRSQRAAMVLKNVRYGIEFHFEMTGIRDEKADEGESKHYNIIKRRLSNGQYFRVPCLGCSEFPVKKLLLVDKFDESEIAPEIACQEDVDLGYMSYRVVFRDGGVPQNGDWENPRFSDQATTVYYRPHMQQGIIDVAKYREELRC